MKNKTHFLNPGDLIHLCNEGVVSTVLGSCAGVFIVDSKEKMVGVSHFVLPCFEAGNEQEDFFRYGENALPYLLKKMKINGSKRDNLKVYLFGGASTFNNSNFRVGALNIAYVEKFCQMYGLELIEMLAGGNRGVSVRYNLGTGEFKYHEVVSNSHFEAAMPSKLICIGASTGGTNLVIDMFKDLNNDFPPILYVQHMPELFVKDFSLRLSRKTGAKVSLVKGSMALEKNTIYLSPGDVHIVLHYFNKQLKLQPDHDPPVNSFRPSVDKLFLSAKDLDVNILGILLTGMGDDGVQGLLELRNSNHKTIVQDEASSAVWGMPRRALEAGASDLILSPDDIMRQINQFSTTGKLLTLKELEEVL